MLQDSWAGYESYSGMYTNQISSMPITCTHITFQVKVHVRLLTTQGSYHDQKPHDQSLEFILPRNLAAYCQTTYHMSSGVGMRLVPDLVALSILIQ